MKKTTLTLSAFLILAFNTALVAEDIAAKGGGSHLGTWQLVSTRYGDATEFSDFAKDSTRLKLITATHFAVLGYDAKTKKVAVSLGGLYSLKDGVYVETVEFGSDGTEDYIGKKQEFTIKIDGDKLLQTGKLSNGTKIAEVWQRVKQ